MADQQTSEVGETLASLSPGIMRDNRCPKNTQLTFVTVILYTI
jgi:hypothetical protein